MLSCVAPMDGITDAAYRHIIWEIFQKHRKVGDETLLYTEFMSSAGYVKNPQGVINHIMCVSNSGPCIAQIYDGDYENLLWTAQDLIKKYKFSGIELNIGCPSPKVMACGGGVGMLKQKYQTKKIIINLAKELDVPFSIKTRIGLDEADKKDWFDVLCEVAPYCSSVAIHGRTYKQGHKGVVDRNFVYDLKNAIQDEGCIIGNGGIKNYNNAMKVVGNLDGVMSAQGAIGNPRIVVPYSPTVEERLATILRHLMLHLGFEVYYRTQNIWVDGVLQQPSVDDIEQYARFYQEHIPDCSSLRTTREFRKHLFRYIAAFPGSKEMRKKVSQITEYDLLVTAIEDFFMVFK